MFDRALWLRGSLMGLVCAMVVDAGAAPPIAEADFRACVSELAGAAAGKGIAPERYRALTAGLVPDQAVLELLDAQPEFKLPIWDYLAGLVDEERVQDGQAGLQRWGEVLDKIERQYAVPREVVVAVWGVESNFGQTLGKRPLLNSLATLSCAGRRQSFFRGEFFETLRIVERGDIAAERLNGSWAGAFGQTQFMPSTYSRLAVDFDGDGRRDIVDSVPDALASTANFLARGGWRTGEPWGFEVRLPKGAEGFETGRRNKQPLSTWRARGLTLADGRPLPSDGPPAGLLMPAGAEGPGFLVMRNFDVIYGYNAAESYALAIALLADRLAGGPGLRQPWPTDDPGLSRAERRELQRLLLARGHDIGEPDGVIGARSREAIEREQARLGLKVDGRAGQRTLEALRSAAR